MEEPKDRLQAARIAAGYDTPADAIEAFGFKGPTYYQHENGTRPISKAAAERYSRAYKVTPAHLLYGVSVKQEQIEVSSDEEKAKLTDRPRVSTEPSLDPHLNRPLTITPAAMKPALKAIILSLKDDEELAEIISDIFVNSVADAQSISDGDADARSYEIAAKLAAKRRKEKRPKKKPSNVTKLFKDPK